MKVVRESYLYFNVIVSKRIPKRDNYPFSPFLDRRTLQKPLPVLYEYGTGTRTAPQIWKEEKEKERSRNTNTPSPVQKRKAQDFS